MHVTGSVAIDLPAFMLQHDRHATAVHSGAVAEGAQRIARLYAVGETQAQQAAWLHDVSAVFPGPERARVADALGVEVLPEERAYPPILHQKLSVVLARELFGITDEAVLDAIGCHTTLRTGATALDQVVFLADKLAWDQPGRPPYWDALQAALAQSLAAACLVYLDYLWQRRDTLPIVHPWMRDAHQELLNTSKGPTT